MNAIDPETKKLRAPTESGLGYPDSAGTSRKKVPHFVKQERASKAQGDIDRGIVHY